MSYRVYRGAVTHLDATLSISGGGGGGSTIYAANTLTTDRQELVGPVTENIAAGAYRVSVRNTGLENITVNTDVVPPNGLWEVEMEFNKTNSRQDFCPAVQIEVPAGGDCAYSAVFPST
jgi:hypothetical protein